MDESAGYNFGWPLLNIDAGTELNMFPISQLPEH